MEQSNRGELLREFWRGLIRPSLGALVVTAIVLIACLALTLIYLDEQVAARMLRSKAFPSRDSKCTAHILEISHSRDTRPSIMIVGASATRASINNAFLLQALTAQTENKPRLISLESGAQSIWQSVAYTDKLNPDFRGVVVFGVSHTRLIAHDKSVLTRLFNEPRFGFVSPSFDDEVHRAGLSVPRRTGIYALDNRHFFLPRVRYVTGFVNKNFRARQTNHRKDPDRVQQRRKDQLKTLDPQSKLFKDHLDTIGRLIDRLQSRQHVRIVLLQAPVNPQALYDADAMDNIGLYKEKMKSFADNKGVLFLDIQDDAKLVPDEFSDLVHLKDPKAIQRYTSILASHLVTQLNEVLTEIK